MDKFDVVYRRACERQGGEQAIAAMMPAVRSRRALAATADDRWLAEMTRCTFQAGFVWRVVNQKWDDFEDLFFGFPPEKILLLSPEQIDRIASNPKIVRNRQKVLCVQQNAQFITDVARKHGSFGTFVGQWPAQDLVGLFAELKKRGARLGGITGPRVLRNMGKDTFILTGDVLKCLRGAGVAIGDSPTSQRELKLAQSTFNAWQQESALPYSHLSRIAALSV